MKSEDRNLEERKVNDNALAQESTNSKKSNENEKEIGSDYFSLRSKCSYKCMIYKER